MKSGKLLILAFFVPSLLCPAQDTTPVGKPVDAAVPVSAPAVAPVSAPVKAEDTYTIGETDVLSVTVWKEATLSGSLLVRPDGKISMPLLGDVQASGLTPLQLADKIATDLKKYIQDPKVSVVLTGINSKKVYMLGEVSKRGPIDMTSGMTLLQAIGSAGGLTDNANAKKIYLLRVEAGKQQKIAVHYKEALRGDSTFNLVLKSGDTIVVP